MESFQNLARAIHTNTGWVNALFQSSYSLFPVFGRDSLTQELLTRKSLLQQLMRPIIAKANLNLLIKNLLGFDLPTLPSGGLVAECYEILERNYEGKKSLNDRINNIFNNLVKKELVFGSVQIESSLPNVPGKSLPILWDRDRVDRKFVSVYGVLCNLERIRDVPSATVGKTTLGSGVEWLLCDLPFFVLGHTEFFGGVVLVEFENGVVEQLEGNIPFIKDIGWYPYVKISGECRKPRSPKYPLPSIQVSYLEYRTPKSVIEMQDELEKAAFPNNPIKNGGFHIDKNSKYDSLLFLHTLEILSRSLNLNIEDLPDRVKKLYDEIRKSLPDEVIYLLPKKENAIR